MTVGVDIPEDLQAAGAAAPMVRRQLATQATLDQFRGRAFSWSGGKTCLHLMHAHLRHCGVKVPRLPTVRSPLGARRALDRRGQANMAEVIDSLGLERLPAPAMMTVGDLAYRSSADGFGGVLICVGAGQLLGWAELVAASEDDAGEAVEGCEVFIMALDQVEACWRVPIGPHPLGEAAGEESASDEGPQGGDA